jgi:hypothetical protein
MNDVTTIEAPPQLGDGLAELRDRIAGRVSGPDDAEWDAERAAWALAVDQRPALVVRAAHAEDVAAAVRFAALHGLRVAAQGTGHNAGPLGDLGDTLLLRTDLMRGVTIDAERMIARVDAGVLWQQVTEAAAEHGLAALAGSSADVGVVGYTLGGGVSWLARSHGLGANSVIAIELVTADGEICRVDEQNDPHLFWALRGGGGAFGVVTALEFRLYPMTGVHAGAFFWPIERAADVMHAWREWTVDLPASVMSAARVMAFPPIVDVPEPLRGRAFVIVEAVLQDAAAAADALLSELRRLEPTMDTFATVPLPALSALHMDPPGPTPGVGDGALIRELDEDAVDAFLSVAATARGQSIGTAEFRLLGAALAPGQESGGAVSGLNGSYLLFAGGMAPTADSAAVVRHELDDLLATMAPWRSDSDYLNFAESPVSAERLYGAALPRLREVKRRIDPHDIIRSNHPLGAGR